MKHLILSIIVCFSGAIYGHIAELGGLPGYTITSDVKDSTIANGDVIIGGNIRMFSSALPIAYVRVGTNSNEVLTDSLGDFTLLAKASDTVFFCYRSGWSEIYELNPEFKSQHRITISAYLNQRQMLMKKPVIYLYNNTPLNAVVKIVPNGEFTFTYPKYDNGWSVTVQPNGGITDLKSNKEFPYLFWEAETDHLFF